MSIGSSPFKVAAPSADLPVDFPRGSGIKVVHCMVDILGVIDLGRQRVHTLPWGAGQKVSTVSGDGAGAGASPNNGRPLEIMMKTAISYLQSSVVHVTIMFDTYLGRYLDCWLSNGLWFGAVPCRHSKITRARAEQVRLRCVLPHTR
jgi:hypothetical protein